MSTWKLLHQPGVAFTLFLWCFVSLQGLANTAVVPVFWFTSIPLGGYGFSPIQISLFLGLGGDGPSPAVSLAVPWWAVAAAFGFLLFVAWELTEKFPVWSGTVVTAVIDYSPPAGIIG